MGAVEFLRAVHEAQDNPIVSEIDILRLVSKRTLMSTALIKSRYRGRAVSMARKMACYLMNRSGYSSEHIGLIVNRESSTVRWLTIDMEKRVTKAGTIRNMIRPMEIDLGITEADDE